ncbi:MAG: hypothetical protein ACYTEL_22725 [Planctomycetota bacterium]|jgi:hypothetical protein
MDKGHVKKLAENPDFIPGVYNYCDRWCERCSFTCRCMTYALSEEQFSDPQTHDINNKAFWDQLAEIFRVTREMVEEFAAQQGIDLSSLDLRQAHDEHRSDRDDAKNHECCLAAKTYLRLVDDWFDSARQLFEQTSNELNRQLELGLQNCDPFGEAAGIKGCVDVIRWYQHLIYVKLLRAIGGSFCQGPEDYEYLPDDSNGSAKVALIAIDRSIAAWGQMRNHFPERSDEIIDTLVHLDRLRTMIQATFPNARTFIRPGLDEQNPP